jgi:ATP-binding cassette subfamily E protein 1
LKIKEDNFFYINNVSVDVNIELLSGNLNILTGKNGVGKTTFVNHLQNYVDGVFICFQHRLSSVNSTRVKDLIEILKNNNLIDSSQLEVNIKLFRFQDLINREIKELSGGENQILKIIITLSSLKELLIFDEPSQYLDTENLSYFKCALKECNQKVLIIEHNLSYLDLTSVSKLQMAYNSTLSKLEVLNV